MKQFVSDQKLLIAKADSKTLVNKRSEIVGCVVITLSTHRDVYANCLNTKGISQFTSSLELHVHTKSKYFLPL